MLCKNCGNEIPDGAKFCGNCGFTTENEEVFENTEAPVQSEAVTEEPMQNEAVTEAPAQPEATPAFYASDTPSEGTNFAQASFDQNIAPAKKKKKIAPIIIATVAIVLVVAIVLSIVIINKNKKSQDSDGNLFTVLSRNTDVEEKAQAFVDMYDTHSTKLNTGSKTQIKLNLPEETAKMLDSFLTEKTGVNTNFAALNDLTLDYNISLADSKYQVKMILNCANQTLIEIDEIIDYEEMVMYIGCPTLSDTYLKFPMMSQSDGEFANNTVIMETYQSLLSGEIDVSKLLPTKEELSTIVKTYIGIAKPYLENDSKKASTLTVNNITQDVTEYTMDITEKEMMDMILSVLETAKNDPTIFTIVDRFTSFISENVLPISERFEKITREDFVEAIDKAIAEIKEEEPSSDILFSLVRFVNSDDMIIGRKIYSEGEEVFYHATVTKGSSYASTIELAEFSIDGNGTIADGKKTGTYDISFEDTNITLNVKDFSVNSKGITGSIIYYLDDEVIDKITDNDFFSMFASSAKLGVELKFLTVSETKGAIELNLIAGDKIMAGITFNAEAAPAENISVPSNTTSVENADEWLDNFDEEDLKDIFRNSPLSFFVDLLEKVSNEETHFAPALAHY